MQHRSSRVKMRSRPIDMNKPLKLTITDVDKDEELEELILTVRLTNYSIDIQKSKLIPFDREYWI